MTTSMFDNSHPETGEVTCRKSAYSICTFLRYSQFYSVMTRVTTSIIENVNAKIFESTFNFYVFVSMCIKSRYFILSFKR